MSVINAVRLPVAGASSQAAAPHEPHATQGEQKSSGLFSKRNIALGGIGAAALAGGTLIGALRGNPLMGLGIGAAVGATAIGAALLGSAGDSQRNGWCEYYGDPDCDYPGTGGYYPPYDDGGYDPYYPPYDGGYDPSYPDPSYPDPYYPGGSTSPGDDY